MVPRKTGELAPSPAHVLVDYHDREHFTRYTKEITLSNPSPVQFASFARKFVLRTLDASSQPKERM